MEGVGSSVSALPVDTTETKNEQTLEVLEGCWLGICYYLGANRAMSQGAGWKHCSHPLPSCLGGVGSTRFGVLEWREPLVLVSIVDQLRSGVLSMGSAKGLDVGWACCHLDQQIVSTIPAWILLGVVQFGVRQLWSGSCLYLLSQSWAVCTSQKRGFVHAVPVVLTGQVRGL